MYKNIIQRIHNEVKFILDGIETVHNFELGSEFELAICRILKKILPTQFGVCRGYVVTKDDEIAGDDIIIYNKSIFPELRLTEKDDYIMKQYIPIEAVCVYIECKNSIELVDQTKKNSIKYALGQVRKVRDLINKRGKRKWNEFDRHIEEKIDLSKKPAYLPKYRNEPYTILLSRYYSINNEIRKDSISRDEVLSEINKIIKEVDYDAIDFQVINESFAVCRYLKNDKNIHQPSIFGLEDSDILLLDKVNSYGMLVILILYICDFTNLKPINWVEVMNKEIDKCYKSTEKS